MGLFTPDTPGGVGVPGQGGAGVPGQPDSPDAEQALNDALDALHAFMSSEQDHQDKAIAAKCVSALQGILGGRQKQDEAAMGTTPGHKAVARAMRSRGQARGGAVGGGY